MLQVPEQARLERAGPTMTDAPLHYPAANDAAGIVVPSHPLSRRIRGWLFWAPDANIYSYLAPSITSDYNQWYHTSTTRPYRVPAAEGGSCAISSSCRNNQVVRKKS